MHCFDQTAQKCNSQPVIICRVLEFDHRPVIQGSLAQMDERVIQAEVTDSRSHPSRKVVRGSGNRQKSPTRHTAVTIAHLRPRDAGEPQHHGIAIAVQHGEPRVPANSYRLRLIAGVSGDDLHLNGSTA